MATDTIARGMIEGVVSQVSADRQAVSEDRAAVETAKTEVLNVAESIPEDYSTLSADVSELKEDLVMLLDEVPTRNLFNKTTITEDVYINDGGVIEDSNLYYTSDYIEVGNSTTISAIAEVETSYPFRIACYDENKVWKKRVLGKTNPYSFGTANYKYIRICFEVSAKFDRNTIQVEDGLTKTDYVPHKMALDYNARKLIDGLTNRVALNEENMFERYSPQIIDNSIFSSVDDFEINKVYRINCTADSVPTDLPTTKGHLIIYGITGGGAITKAMLFVDLSANLYTRGIWNTGTDWIKLAKEPDVSKLFDTEVSFDFGMFEKFAVIGDSYASGEIYTPNGSGGYTQSDYYNKSWGQIIARKYGSTCINMSAGGLTTKTWLTHAKGLTLLNSSEAQELYICALGHNDEAQGLSYLGTEADMDSKADTFYGNYAKIIEAIKSKAPKSKIVLMSVAYRWSTKEGDVVIEDAYRDAIKNIASHYSIAFIDIKTDSFYSQKGIYQTGKVQNHPTAPIYAGMAKANVRLINKCMKDYYNYFKGFVG